MPKNDLELDSLKNEVLEYLRAAGLPIFYGFGIPGEESYTYWDAGQYPDWRQFVDVAKESGARLLLFSSRMFDADELRMARETLEEVEMADNDRDDANEFLDGIRSKVGHVAWIRVAWQQENRRYAYERVAPWYEKFIDLIEEINDYLPELTDMEDDDEGPQGRGGFYSLN